MMSDKLVEYYLNEIESKDQRIKELEAIINKAKVDPNAEQLGERLIDNSYTGQIAQLKQQLDAVRGLCETSKCTGIPTKSEQGYEQMKMVYVVNRDVIMSIIAPPQALGENDAN